MDDKYNDLAEQDSCRFCHGLGVEVDPRTGRRDVPCRRGHGQNDDINTFRVEYADE